MNFHNLEPMFLDIFMILLILQVGTTKSNKVTRGFTSTTAVNLDKTNNTLSDSNQVVNPRLYLPIYSGRSDDHVILINNWFDDKNFFYSLLENDSLKIFRFNLNGQAYEVLLHIIEYDEPDTNTITINVSSKSTEMFYDYFVKHLEFSLHSLVETIAYNPKAYRRLRKDLKDSENESFIATEFKKHFLPKLDLILQNKIKRRCKKKSSIRDVANINDCLINFINEHFPGKYIRNVLESGEIGTKENYEVLIDRCYEFLDQIYILRRKKLCNRFPPTEFKITMKIISGVKINISNIKRVAFYDNELVRVELNPIDFVLTDGSKSSRNYIFIPNDVSENNNIRYVLEQDLIDIHEQKIIKRIY